VVDVASGERGREDEECDYGKPKSAAIRHEVLALLIEDWKQQRAREAR
jgi:hypothetical protein